MASTPDRKPRLRCQHCGNRTPHKFLHDETLTLGHPEESPPFEDRRWVLLKCSTCRKVCLLGDSLPTSNPGGSHLEQAGVHELRLLWPEVELPSTVPTRVEAAYEEALSVKHHSANAFANQIRKSLEAVCEDRNAEGDNLHNMIGNLKAKGEIPAPLGDMTDLIRMVGNAGSHATEFDVDWRFVEPMDDFFRTVVRYIYELPSQIEQVQNEYDRAASETTEDEELEEYLLDEMDESTDG